jgi:dihydroorotase-like cyclic amidohydrolase
MLVIAGGRVLSPHSPRGEARDIIVDGDTIVDLVAPGAVTNRNAEVLDARRRLIIPA